MAKLLQHWGLGEKLKEKAVVCPKIDYYNGESQRTLSKDAPGHADRVVFDVIIAHAYCLQLLREHIKIQ